MNKQTTGLKRNTTDKYYTACRAVKGLERGEEIPGKDRQKIHTGDFIAKEKEHVIFLTEQGIEKAEAAVGVGSFYTGANMDWPHYIECAIKANILYQRDKDYVIENGEVISK